MIDQKRFDEILSGFNQVKIAVLGDFFLDLYMDMDRSLSDFSLETHKEAFQIVDLRGQAGAAGVAVNNLSSLGAKTSVIGYTGKDGNGFTLRQSLKSVNANIEMLIDSEDRFTPTYIKPMMQELDGKHIELNRMDIINRSSNPDCLNERLAECVRKAIETHDGILLIEQVKNDGHGTMSPILRDVLSDSADVHPEKFIVVDSRYFSANYKNVSLKMNLAEALAAAKQIGGSIDHSDHVDPLSVSASIAETFWKINQKPVFITLGKDGIAGYTKEGFFHIPGYQVEGPIDIVGAGDSVLAGIGLSLCAGAKPKEAAYVGNLVGSITIQQIGATGKATQGDLHQRHIEYQKQLKIG